MKVSNSGIFSNNPFPGSRIPGIPSPCPQLGCFFLHIEAFSNTSTRSWHCNIAASKLQFPWQQLSWRHRVSSHLPSMISSQSLNIKVTQRDSCCRQDGCWLVLPQVPLDYCATNIKWPAIKETLLPVLPQILRPPPQVGTRPPNLDRSDPLDQIFKLCLRQLSCCEHVSIL